ncbi:DUF2188 domain-containing protein [Streptomyces sp. WAC 00631]|uniref:ATP-dependent DNA ligase n=1 Tax=Streptomyces sp. WAC 00631 TaxID=2203201 RepID=UPI000F7B13C9|nr:DUF2188 domain-containing protein [Streptomyces sp. WAC 00631]
MVITPPLEPILARAVEVLPGPTALPGGTMYEPKYDGYRLLVFTCGGRVFLQSRNGNDLTAAFPEIAHAARQLGEDLVLDGEVIIYQEGRLDFASLQRRINRRPATTAHLAREQPAHLIVFDLLHRVGNDLIRRPYRERRAALEALFADHALGAPWVLTPVTEEVDQAREWMRQWAASGVEGVLAKGRNQPYRPGKRGWRKYRHRDTAEGVIGAVTGSLTRPETVLLGRYTGDGSLSLVARSTPLTASLRRELAPLLTPAGPDHPWHGMHLSAHWGSHQELAFTSTAPDLVAEFHGDTAIDRGRWRHPVRVRRLRRDLAPGDVPMRSASAPTPGSAPSHPEEEVEGTDMAAKQTKRAVYHITPAADRPAGEKWQIQHQEGRRAVSEPHRTQRQAIDAAREKAKQHQPAQVVVHGRDGRIRTEYTYGNDPRRTPG